jgi:hypothetical protein
MKQEKPMFRKQLLLIRKGTPSFLLVFGLVSVLISVNLQSGNAVDSTSKCKTMGFIHKKQTQYFQCTKVGKQLILKPVRLNSWQQSIFTSTSLTIIPSKLTEPIESAAGWSIIPFKAEFNWKSDEGKSLISDGSPIANGSGTRVLLLGDSLAAAIAPTFLQIQKSLNWNLRLVFRSSCQVAETRVIYQDKDSWEKCDKARLERLKVVQEFKPDILILIEDPLNPVAPDNGKTAFQTWRLGFKKSLANLETSSSMKVVLMSRPAGVTKALQDCLKGKSQLTLLCFGKASTGKLLRDAQKAEVESIGGSFIDLTPLLCINDSCPPFIGNALVFRDHVHFTNRFAEMLGDQVSVYFKQN